MQQGHYKERHVPLRLLDYRTAYCYEGIMVAVIYVFLGGGLGAVLRYASLALCKRIYVAPFPLGTLCVNVLGSLMVVSVCYIIMHEGIMV